MNNINNNNINNNNNNKYKKKYIDVLIDNIERIKSKTKIKHVTECGIIMLNNDLTKMLIIYQNESCKWGFPKGKMDDNEYISREYFSCAKRELYEETGIILNCNKYKKLGSIIIKNKLFYIIMLQSKIQYSRPLDTMEIGKIKWINIADLCSFINKNNCNITIKSIYDYMNQDNSNYRESVY